MIKVQEKPEHKVSTMSTGNWYKVIEQGKTLLYVYRGDGYFNIFVPKAKGPHTRPQADQEKWIESTITTDAIALVHCEPDIIFVEP